MNVEMAGVDGKEGGGYLMRVRQSRNAPSVLKIKLINFRSQDKKRLIFAFEGNDDKTVYYHWIKRVKPTLKYEPFPCTGKSQLIGLVEMLSRDKSDLSKGVYCFLDRDFDAEDQIMKSGNVFYTDNYSIENYLVAPEVLEEILKNEFHCHGDLVIRDAIISLFRDVYTQFLAITKELNRKLFLSRRLKIDLQRGLPEKIGRIVKITATSVEPAQHPVEDLVVLTRNPECAERSELDAVFDKINGEIGYRGKFAILFFVSWLRALATDRNSENPRLFKEKLNGEKVNAANFTLDCLAAKSNHPAGLTYFLQAMPEAA
jgi:hypothetical protein